MTEKKLTVRLNLDLPEHYETYRSIMNRDRGRYRTITDYLNAAVLHLEAYKDSSPVLKLELSKEERRELCQELLQLLEEYQKEEQPGI
ncbi:MAG: hypothetical protein PHP50_12310 [Lachnospiraceae bacterium]|nr:hypothetical protein [Lachnospiraceae bacterium]